jgi:hypothetical protein
MPQRRTSARFEARRPRRLRLRRGSRPTAAAAVAAAAAAALADTRALQFLVGAQHQVIGARGLGRCAAVRMRLPNGWCGRPTPQPARTSGASGVRRSSARGARSWSRQFLEAEAAVTVAAAVSAVAVVVAEAACGSAPGLHVPKVHRCNGTLRCSGVRLACQPPCPLADNRRRRLCLCSDRYARLVLWLVHAARVRQQLQSNA